MQTKKPSMYVYNYKWKHLFLWNLHFARVDPIDNIVRRLAIDGAPDALGSSEDLLDGTGQGLSERF